MRLRSWSSSTTESARAMAARERNQASSAGATPNNPLQATRRSAIVRPHQAASGVLEALTALRTQWHTAKREGCAADPNTRRVHRVILCGDRHLGSPASFGGLGAFVQVPAGLCG